MIEINNLCFSYGSRQILNQVNLSVRQAEIVGLVGPNGSGKSTLLKCLCGILSPARGSIRADCLYPSATGCEFGGSGH